MCLYFSPGSKDDIKAALLATIQDPCRAFEHHINATLPEELIGYYSDELIQLTRNNQQTVDTSRLPALHEVDLGQNRELDEDASHHLYNLFMLTSGVLGVQLPESVTKFSDTTHNIYHFTPEGLSFNIVERSNDSDIEGFNPKSPATESNLPSSPTLVIQGWGMFQTSPIEDSVKFNTVDDRIFAGTIDLLDATLFTPDESHVTSLQTNGTTVSLYVNRLIDHGSGGAVTYSLFADDNSFSGRMATHGGFLLAWKGPRWAIVDSSFNIVNSGTLSRPIWDAKPLTFSGIPGFAVVTGGSSTNLTQGTAAGGALGFLSHTGYLELKGYAGAPSALYKDGSYLYVGISNSLTDLRWELFDSSLRMVDFDEVVSTVPLPAFGNFFAHNGTIYGLIVKSHSGAAASPVLLDLENGIEIAFTSTTFATPTNFTPHTRIHGVEVPVVDMRTTQTGSAIVANQYRSCAATPPDDGDYQANSKYFVLGYDLNFSLSPLEVNANSVPELGGGGVVDGSLYLQSGGSSFKFSLIPQCNVVVPNARWSRLHTFKEYPSPWKFIEAAGGSYFYHKDGIRYTFSVSTGGYQQIPVDVVDRNDVLYLVVARSIPDLTTNSGMWSYFLIPQSASQVSTTLENTLEGPFTSGAPAFLLEAKTINGTAQYVSIAGQTFDVEDARCESIFNSDRAWTDRRYFTKRFSTFDTGVVLRTNSTRYVETYLPLTECSAIEWNVDLSADNLTITSPRYDRSSQGEYLFRAAGSSDFPGFHDHMVQGQLDVLSFSNAFLTAKNSGVATYTEGIGRVFSGNIESSETTESTTSTKANGIIEKLTAQVKDVTSVTCPYVFGGVQCGVALTKSVGVVTNSTARTFEVEFEAALPLPIGNYRQGILKFISNGFQNVELDVRAVTSLGGLTYGVACYAPLGRIPADADEVQVVLANGCDKTMAACSDYGNLERGRMLPYIQGQRVFTASGQIQDGLT